eukprot:1038200-Pyramimonas_sp.AAC.1
MCELYADWGRLLLVQRSEYQSADSQKAYPTVPREPLWRAEGGASAECCVDLQATSRRDELPRAAPLRGIGPISFVSWTARRMCQLLH